MKKHPAIVITIVVAFLGGCATPPESGSEEKEARQLHYDPTRPVKSEVEQCLGRPDSIETNPTSEVWIYDFEKTRGAAIEFTSYAQLRGSGSERRKFRLVVFGQMDAVDDTWKMDAVRSPITVAMVRSLSDDMPAAKVAALLGAPNRIEKLSEGERWSYEAYTHDFRLRTHFVLGFISGKLTFYPILPDGMFNETIRVSGAGPLIAERLRLPEQKTVTQAEPPSDTDPDRGSPRHD